MSDRKIAIVLSFDSEGFAQLGKGLRLEALASDAAPAVERRVLRFDTVSFDLAAQGRWSSVESEKGGGYRQLSTSSILAFERGVSSPSASALPLDATPEPLSPFAEERLSVRRVHLGGVGKDCACELMRGWIDCSGRSHPVARAVIEGPYSERRALFQAARLLSETAPCDLLLDEGETALSLAQGMIGLPRKSRKLGLGGVGSIHEAFGAIVRMAIEQIAANRVCVFAGDTVEGVHQMRVGVRRLRSAVNLFRPLLDPGVAERISAELKSLAQFLGPLRDGDVFRETILDPVTGLMGGHEGLRRLIETMEKERDDRLSLARATLDQANFCRLMLDLAEWSLDGIADDGADLSSFAAGALDKRHRKISKAGKRFDDLDPLQRHALRIRGKKMRYAGEFLSSLFPEAKAKRYLDSLTLLVDLLGHLNDIAVARRVLEERRAASADQAIHHAVGFAEGWHAGRAAHLEEKAKEAWSHFKRQDRFWE